MHTKREIPAEAYRFSAPVALQGEGDNPRKFSGIAYTGDIIAHPFWGPVAFELSSIKTPGKLPMLIGHDRDKNAGFSENVTISDQGIDVAGVLLSNENGARIAQDAAEGFPWQMSVHIEPEKIEDVEKGATVNGRTFETAGVVFKSSTLREISFTPTGVDAGTSARVFSFSYHDYQSGQSPESQEVNMTKEEAAALTAELEASKQKFAAIEAENAELKHQFAALQEEKEAAEKAARETAIKTLFADIGTELDDAQKEAMLTMSHEQFAAVSELMRKAKPAAPANLFSESNITEPEGGEDPLMAGMQAALAEVQGA